MVGKTERVVLVKGNSTKWYEQAIFIVNKKAPQSTMPVDFIAEAERIIDEFNLRHVAGEPRAVPDMTGPNTAALDTAAPNMVVPNTAVSDTGVPDIATPAIRSKAKRKWSVSDMITGALMMAASLFFAWLFVGRFFL